MAPRSPWRTGKLGRKLVAPSCALPPISEPGNILGGFMEGIGKMYSQGLRAQGCSWLCSFSLMPHRQPHKALEAPIANIPGRAHGPGG